MVSLLIENGKTPGLYFIGLGGQLGHSLLAFLLRKSHEAGQLGAS